MVKGLFTYVVKKDEVDKMIMFYNAMQSIIAHSLILVFGGYLGIWGLVPSLLLTVDRLSKGKND